MAVWWLRFADNLQKVAMDFLWRYGACFQCFVSIWQLPQLELGSHFLCWSAVKKLHTHSLAVASNAVRTASPVSRLAGYTSSLVHLLLGSHFLPAHFFSSLKLLVSLLSALRKTDTLFCAHLKVTTHNSLLSISCSTLHSSFSWSNDMDGALPAHAFYHAMLYISAAYTIMRCLSVCPSVRLSICHIRELRQNE